MDYAKESKSAPVKLRARFLWVVLSGRSEAFDLEVFPLYLDAAAVVDLKSDASLSLADEFVGEIAVVGGSILGDGIHVLDSVIHIVSQSLFLFFLGNVSLVEHILENDFSFLRIFFPS